MHTTRLAGLAAALFVALTASASAYTVRSVAPVLETKPSLPDNAIEADADDPAVWIAPNAKQPSLVITAVKNGGLRVYDLAGKRLQVIDPVIGVDRKGRINNVDVAYGVK